MYSDLAYWRNSIGLLPINLEHNQEKEVNKYAMLDGDVNNFGLAFLRQDDDGNYRNKAWSSNMHNFVTVKGDNLILYRTSGDNKEEYNYSFVRDNLSSFYKYLTLKQDKEPKGVVNFLMEEYAKIRTALREVHGDNAVSLTALLYMLTSVNHQVTSDNLKVYGLPDNTLDIIGSIKDNSLIGQIVEDVQNGTGGFKPDITLLLRHAAGRLFEEANFMVRINPQLNLFPSNELKYYYDPRFIGAYYTPTYIARSVVDYALNHYDFGDKGKITIFDPACGSGEFLVESLRQLKSMGYDGEINIIGYDLSHSAVIIAKYILAFESIEWGDKLKFTVESKDSIISDWPKVDLLFMNPPYSSWEQMDKKYTSYIREKLGIKRMSPNIASIFYHKAVRSLNEEGIVGSVMPSAFLYSVSTSAIRNSSLDYARPLLIARLGNFVFPKAYVDVCAVIAKETNSSNQTTMVWTNNVDDIVPEVIRQFRISSYTNKAFRDTSNYSAYSVNYKEIEEKNIWMPLSATMYRQKHRYETWKQLKAFTSVSKVFDVMQGARTGANRLFKISSEEYGELTETEKHYFRPAIDNHSLRKNRINVVNYLFFPYTDDGITINSEEELRERCPVLYEKIMPFKDGLVSRRDAGDKWWLLSWPREWQYKKFKKLVSGEFGNSDNFSIDTTGDFVVERGCYWRPKNKMKEDEVFFYFGIFSSTYFNDLLALYSRQLAGGNWYGLSKRFVDNIPLPIFENIPDELITELVKYAQDLLLGNRECREIQSRLVKYFYEQI